MSSVKFKNVKKIMATILGIDAAWTEKEPSGVALISATSDGWRSIAVAPSYDIFIDLAGNKKANWNMKTIKGSPPDIFSLLTAAERLAGEQIQIVAIDMPVATVPFKGRRVADNAISIAFGSRWCSAHSPNSERPGRISRNISTALEASGYQLAVDESIDTCSRCLLEVYPHTALLSLLQRGRRVPYKISKSKRYWPDTDIEHRKANLLLEFQAIYDCLESVFGRLNFTLPEIKDVPSLTFLKRYEDALDALVCAWVGVRFTNDETTPLGDSTAAIWCPRDVVKFEHGQKPPRPGITDLGFF